MDLVSALVSAMKGVEPGAPAERVAGSNALDLAAALSVVHRPEAAVVQGSALEQIEQLRNTIRHHDRRYYGLEDPEISDDAYNALMGRLRALEDENPGLVDPSSPTQRIGGALSDKLEKVVHRAPMLSIETAATDEAAWASLERMARGLGTDIESLVFCLEPKYDGLALSSVWRYGRLELAATRGDHTAGEDVTTQARTIRTLPLYVAQWAGYERVEVRGEAMMLVAEFEALKASTKPGEREYLSARNAASGTLRAGDPAVAASRKLVFYAHAFGACSDDFPLPESQHERLEVLRAAGFAVSPLCKVVKGATLAHEFVQRLEGLRSTLAYEIDGAVLKIDSVAQCQELGDTAREPRWAMAWKFKPQGAVTRVLRIRIQVGRTGKLTPVVDVEPVMLASSRQTKASLDNEGYLQRLGVHEGCLVELVRSGDVIPRVKAVVAPATTTDGSAPAVFCMPDKCPACGSAIRRDPAIANVFCTGGMSCPPQQLNLLDHFASRDAANIDGLGGAKIEQLLDAGLITHRASSLWQIDADTLSELEGWGQTSADNLMRSIAGCRGLSLERFIFSLGIPGVGKGTSKRLSERYESWQQVADARLEDLTSIRDVGPLTATAIRSWLDLPGNREEAQTLSELMQPLAGVKQVTGGALHGMRIVITGTTSIKRSVLTQMLVAAGATVGNSVSSKTSLLVSTDTSTEKHRQALEHRVRIVDEATILEMLKG